MSEFLGLIIASLLLSTAYVLWSEQFKKDLKED